MQQKSSSESTPEARIRVHSGEKINSTDYEQGQTGEEKGALYVPIASCIRAPLYSRHSELTELTLITCSGTREFMILLSVGSEFRFTFRVC